MSYKTKIEWSQATWNPVDGCTQLSEACAHCYARAISKRFWGERPFSQIKFHPKRLNLPLGWKKPRMIFVCSMGDLFHKDVDANWIDQIIEMAETQKRHTFLFLTKRPGRMSHWRFPDNCWTGVTVEKQKYAALRIEQLITVDSRVKFVSVEPMLEPINLEPWLFANIIQWVICGAETGPGARPMDSEWGIHLRDQCQEFDVPFFFKRMGNRQTIPMGLMIREYPE